MKKFAIIGIILLLFSCSKDRSCSKDLPDCISDIIKNDTYFVAIKTIKVQMINGECHYWLNTDARHYDLYEEIVNSLCDRVCIICSECNPPDCIKKYESDKWETIWEK